MGKAQKDKNSFNKNQFNDFRKINSDGNQPNFMKNIIVWVLFGSFVFFLYIFFDQSQTRTTTITYSEYENILNQGIIKTGKVIKDESNNFEFIGKLKQPITITVNGKPKEIDNFSVKLGFVDAQTEQLWKDKGITWTYEVAKNNFWGPILTILPFVLLIFIWFYFMRGFQGGQNNSSKNIFNFGKARIKQVDKNEMQITFQDVAGADESKEELVEVIDFLKDPSRFQKLGGKIPKGVLLVGPPGTGKTLLARAVAGEAGVPFFSISGADFVEMFVGVGASRVRDLFDQAKKSAPCIVFIDELDAVGRHRGAGLGGGHDEREQTLNQLLVEMDGFEQNLSIIVMAATNRPDVLDPALLRPGRFDRQIVVDLPDVNGRRDIFKVHTRKLPLSKDVDFETLARSTPGLSGADIANICNEAALHAARRNSTVVTMYDFEMAKDKILMGVERKSMVISPKEKELTAYHEMGHALVGRFLPNTDPVHKITIIPRGRALGLTAYTPKEEQHSQTQEYIENQITILLGGRSAEKIIFDSLTNGAANDLMRATKLARKMVTEWGMSDAVGPVCFNNEQQEVFLGRDFVQAKDHSEETAQLIDSEVRKILINASTIAERVLTEHIDLLHKGAALLIERETLDNEEFEALVQGIELPPISNKKMEALRNIKLGVKEKIEEVSPKLPSIENLNLSES
ncbi:MAG: ATP-dependent zinc metalloprotease FtsH [Chloroherpetonaceae bacterium]